ncbi:MULTISPECIES: cell division protein ZipA [unclassified Pseudoalteromonas]|uniref:cell division protein ZipA n=2 Tax=Bacteria TaxID=2 RepID=UPI000B3C4AFE|nr:MULTISPECIES: cell division protein ZipA [unclassified Pseudoalteromonas]MDN3380073.1 cell division protein ZipA [Pseudoalteromonas sp. APC 3893]MDN3388412.1 cell division protein ZipA [Pseudoalteromonas sp. APC 4017]OUS68598.1 cell division protein ZipA [Pseudoalteromonas sp. A601]
MAEQLRWVLIIISVIVIGGLLIHGLWSVRKKDEPATTADERVEPTEQAPVQQTAAEPIQERSAERDEPQFGDLSFSAADEQHEPQQSVEQTPEELEEPKAESESAAPAADFIIVHIQMPEGMVMEGSKLLPAVNTLGFKYSEEGFFNRHLDPAGLGPVLFRLVNMYNPGTFDIDNMEQFSTAGISLFMTLPCDGDGLAAFNMLHSAAKKLADEFGATILDSQREEMTVDSVREYVEKVRSFCA